MYRMTSAVRTAAMVGVALFAAYSMTVRAQQPGGGAQPSAEEQTNLVAVKDYSSLIMQGKFTEAFEKYVSKDFVDHSHLVRGLTGKDKPGYEDTLAFLQKEMGNLLGMGAGSSGGMDAAAGASPAGMAGAPATAFQDVVANDDVVVEYGANGADVFRLVNGKIVAHWDVTPKQGVQYQSRQMR